MPQASTSQIHAHEVLNLVGDHDGQLTTAALQAKITERFGAGARFFACFGEGLAMDELLPALIEREKLSEIDGKLSLLRHNVCS